MRLDETGLYNPVFFCVNIKNTHLCGVNCENKIKKTVPYR